MPTVLLSRGPVAKLVIQHGDNVVRIFGTYRTEAGSLRIVLTPSERDALVQALTSPPPASLSVVDLVRQGALQRSAGNVRYAHDAEDRIQDAIAQVWQASARSEAKGELLPAPAIQWLFRKRVSSRRDRFVPRTATRGKDALDPRLTGVRSTSELDLEAAAMTGFSPEELCLIKETLLALDATDQAIANLRISGHSLEDVGKAMGTSTATVHRRERLLVETLRGR